MPGLLLRLQAPKARLRKHHDEEGAFPTTLHLTPLPCGEGQGWGCWR